ncbi:MAG TPA: FMN-binding protein [Usitatibacteraceae bacterium]
MKNSLWIALPSATAAIVAMPAAYAAQYLSVEAAQQQIFGAARFEPLHLALTPAQQQQINASAIANSNIEPRIWQVREGDKQGEKLAGYFFVHDVIGKQDYITYAVALDAEGKVKTVEILAYRESHGFEIRNARWRAQFAGKRASDTVKLDADIANISGATLSCRHVTDGVRRILAIYEAALKDLR